MSQGAPLLQGLTKYQLGLRFYLQAQLGKIYFQAYIVAEFSSLWICWTEGFSFLLAVGWRLPLVPCHVGLSTEQLSTQQLASLKPARERVSRQDYITILCNIKQKSHSIIFALYSVGQKQVIHLPHLRGGKYTRICITEGVDHWGPSQKCLTAITFPSGRGKGDSGLPK